MDVDGDGFLEKEDFEALTERWVALRGGADRARLTEIMMGWWEELLAASDRNWDDKITLDEVLVLVDRLPQMVDAVRWTAGAIFEAVDENGDGRISAGEYRQLIETWNGQATDTDDVFHRLDRDGDGELSGLEFVELWTEFWVGDDPTAPGTWVFGRFDPTQEVSR